MNAVERAFGRDRATEQRWGPRTLDLDLILFGDVTLDDFGVMAAKWTNERLARNPATGEPVVVPPYRDCGFTPSIGVKTGTRNGTIMTDLQAKPPTP